MNQFTTDQVKSAYDKAPDFVRAAIDDEKTLDVILALGRDYKLHVDQIGLLSASVTNLLLGLLNPQDFQQTLAAGNLSHETINAITKSINEKIFVPLHAQIRSGNVPTKAPAPSAPRPQTPPGLPPLQKRPQTPQQSAPRPPMPRANIVQPNPPAPQPSFGAPLPPRGVMPRSKAVGQSFGGGQRPQPSPVPPPPPMPRQVPPTPEPPMQPVPPPPRPAPVPEPQHPPTPPVPPAPRPAPMPQGPAQPPPNLPGQPQTPRIPHLPTGAGQMPPTPPPRPTSPPPPSYGVDPYREPIDDE